MKNLFTFIIIVLGLASCSSSKVAKEMVSAEAKFQKELVEFYANSKTTPLNQEEIARFVGITFFPIDAKYNVLADFTVINDGNVIPFPTSAGKIKYYKEYGIANFTIDGVEQSLKIYQSSPIQEEYKDHLFLPFTDDTNGVTTYGGGRYIDLHTIDSFTEDGKVKINFNEAYNPYCAYSSRYNCPIPPGDNSLDIAIQAGVTYNKK